VAHETGCPALGLLGGRRTDGAQHELLIRTRMARELDHQRSAAPPQQEDTLLQAGAALEDAFGIASRKPTI
jgi:hypothetical protein